MAEHLAASEVEGSPRYLLSREELFFETRDRNPVACAFEDITNIIPIKPLYNGEWPRESWSGGLGSKNKMGSCVTTNRLGELSEDSELARSGRPPPGGSRSTRQVAIATV